MCQYQKGRRNAGRCLHVSALKRALQRRQVDVQVMRAPPASHARTRMHLHVHSHFKHLHARIFPTHYMCAPTQVNTSNPPPYDPPDIIVATPGGLREVLTNTGGAYGWLWTIEGFEKRVRHVVLDEADMLFGDAYIKPVEELLQVRLAVGKQGPTAGTAVLCAGCAAGLHAAKGGASMDLSVA